jgi:hypothetical protein
MASEFPSSRVRSDVRASRRFWPFATAASLALLAATGCSSKNPDTLVGMNLDENAAMMDANASVDANNASADVAEANESAHSATASRTDASDGEAAPRQPTPPKAEATRHSDQVNATDVGTGNRADPEPIDDNQDDAPEVPNAV